MIPTNHPWLLTATQRATAENDLLAGATIALYVATMALSLVVAAVAVRGYRRDGNADTLAMAAGLVLLTVVARLCRTYVAGSAVVPEPYNALAAAGVELLGLLVMLGAIYVD